MNVFEACVVGDGGKLSLRLPDGLCAGLRRRRVHAARCATQLLKRERVVIGVRPYAVRRAKDGVPATVSANQWLGDQTHIAADFAGGSLVLVEHDRTRLELGEPIGVRIDPQNLHVFDADERRGHLARRGACLMRDILIGIDAGTSVIKSVAFDAGGRQIAFAALPNSYETIAGRRRRAGSGAHLGGCGDHAAAARRQGAGPRRPHRGDRRDRAGRRHLADRQGGRAGRARAGSGSTRGRPRWSRRSGARPDDRDRFEKTGTGLAACQQGSQLAWMQAQPARNARATRRPRSIARTGSISS